MAGFVYLKENNDFCKSLFFYDVLLSEIVVIFERR